MNDRLIDMCADVHQAYLDADYNFLEAMSATFDFLAFKLNPIHENAIDDYWTGYLDAFEDIKKILFEEAGSVPFDAHENGPQEPLAGLLN